MGFDHTDDADNGERINYPGRDGMGGTVHSETPERPRLIYAHPCPATHRSKDTRTRTEDSYSAAAVPKTRLTLHADNVLAADLIGLVLGLLGSSTKLEIKEIQTVHGSSRSPMTMIISLKTGR